MSILYEAAETLDRSMSEVNYHFYFFERINHSRKLDGYSQRKKGLMQQLFPSEVA